jgi:hypothetical protein
MQLPRRLHQLPICAISRGSDSARLNFGDAGGDRLLGSEPVQHNIATQLGQRLGGRNADPTEGAGDERGFSLKHRILLAIMRMVAGLAGEQKVVAVVGPG